MKKYLLLLFLIGRSIQTHAALKKGPEFRYADFGPKCECEFEQGGDMEYTADGDCVPTDPPDCAEDGTCPCEEDNDGDGICDDGDDCIGGELDDGDCCELGMWCACSQTGVCIKCSDGLDAFCPSQARTKADCICYNPDDTNNDDKDTMPPN